LVKSWEQLGLLSSELLVTQHAGIAQFGELLELITTSSVSFPAWLRFTHGALLAPYEPRSGKVTQLYIRRSKQQKAVFDRKRVMPRITV
jgi:hypothetical protein